MSITVEIILEVKHWYVYILYFHISSSTVLNSTNLQIFVDDFTETCIFMSIETDRQQVK